MSVGTGGFAFSEIKKQFGSISKIRKREYQCLWKTYRINVMNIGRMWTFFIKYKMKKAQLCIGKTGGESLDVSHATILGSFMRFRSYWVWWIAKLFSNEARNRSVLGIHNGNVTRYEGETFICNVKVELDFAVGVRGKFEIVKKIFGGRSGK